MKFRKFGKALLMSAVSIGAVFSVTSCVQSYTVGFLYVTGTQTSSTTGQGIIIGFKIDHNTGKLSSVAGLPISSGGAYPNRAVLLSGSRFLYVLNQGGNNCSSSSVCTNANITQFSVGGNGVLAQQQTFYSQGHNPFRLVADASGNYLYVLDHDAPSSSACSLVLGTTSCGDITAFKIDPSTGRLSLVLNAQVTSASGQPLPYFPVPSDPIDMVLSGGYILTLGGTPSTGDEVFPYTYNSNNGQLTVSQNGVQTLGVSKATAIQAAGSFVWVLDDEVFTYTSNSNTVTVPSKLLAYNVGTGGSLQTASGSPFPDTASQSNPLFLIQESKGKWIYVANTGDNSSQTTAQSGIAEFVIDTQKQLTEISGSPFGSGAGPQCLVEDPSDQFIYTANFNDSTVTGGFIDANSGLLRPLKGNANRAYSLPGPATYCVVNGRTS